MMSPGRRVLCPLTLLGVVLMMPWTAAWAQHRVLPAVPKAAASAEVSTLHTPAHVADVAEDEVEPNNSTATAQPLEGTSPLTINGSIHVDDVGDVAFFDNDGNLVDDIEDLFLLVLGAPGVSITLTGLAADCDVYVIDEGVTTVIAASALEGVGDETIDEPTLEAGTYFIGVSIFEPNPGPATESTYTLTVIGAIPTAVEAADDLPDGFTLDQNYPNPFNPETLIRYAVPSAMAVRLEVFDLRGRRVRTLVDAEQAAGAHSVRWDGRSDAGAPVGSGAYVYRLQTETVTTARTLLLLR